MLSLGKEVKDLKSQVQSNPSSSSNPVKPSPFDDLKPSRARVEKVLSREAEGIRTTAACRPPNKPLPLFSGEHFTLWLEKFVKEIRAHNLQDSSDELKIDWVVEGLSGEDVKLTGHRMSLKYTDLREFLPAEGIG